MASPAVAAIAIIVICSTIFTFIRFADFPAPGFAAACEWWKINLEVFQQKSMCRELKQLHKLYGISPLSRSHFQLSF